jgi:hypothetical protein
MVTLPWFSHFFSQRSTLRAEVSLDDLCLSHPHSTDYHLLAVFDAWRLSGSDESLGADLFLSRGLPEGKFLLLRGELLEIGVVE